MNELLLQATTHEQRELFLTSALDDYLVDTERDERRRAEAISGAPATSRSRRSSRVAATG